MSCARVRDAVCCVAFNEKSIYAPELKYYCASQQYYGLFTLFPAKEGGGP